MENIVSKPKAILFDWDNTLVDSWPTIHHAMAVTFETMGHKPWTLEETKVKVHRSMRDAFPDIFGDKWPSAAELYQKIYRSVHLERLVSMPEAENMLNALHKITDIYVGVVSNKSSGNLQKEVSHINWNVFFKTVVGATDAPEDKPSAAPVHLALSGSSLKPNEDIWFVGDSVTDMECAHNSGCLPVFFGERDFNDGAFLHCPPKLVFKNHKELIATVEKF